MKVGWIDWLHRDLEQWGKDSRRAKCRRKRSGYVNDHGEERIVRGSWSCWHYWYQKAGVDCTEDQTEKLAPDRRWQSCPSRNGSRRKWPCQGRVSCWGVESCGEEEEEKKKKKKEGGRGQGET